MKLTSCPPSGALSPVTVWSPSRWHRLCQTLSASAWGPFRIPLTRVVLGMKVALEHKQQIGAGPGSQQQACENKILVE